jgi:hypothetical protein
MSLQDILVGHSQRVIRLELDEPPGFFVCDLHRHLLSVHSFQRSSQLFPGAMQPGVDGPFAVRARINLRVVNNTHSKTYKLKP